MCFFCEVVELCGEAGLVKLGRVAVDGRKVKGNAAVTRNRTRSRVEKEIHEILEEAERIDAKEEEANDLQQLAPLLEGCEEVTGRRPSELLADAGYWSKSDLELGGEQTERFVATMKGWEHVKELRKKGPPRGRIPKHYGTKERMARKLRTKRGAQTCEQRSQVEAVFGQMEMRGLDAFLLRGRKGAGGEWALFSITHNLLKLWRSSGLSLSGAQPAPA